MALEQRMKWLRLLYGRLFSMYWLRLWAIDSYQGGAVVQAEGAVGW